VRSAAFLVSRWTRGGFNLLYREPSISSTRRATTCISDNTMHVLGMRVVLVRASDSVHVWVPEFRGALASYLIHHGF
jgi:hypothetical protein